MLLKSSLLLFLIGCSVCVNALENTCDPSFVTIEGAGLFIEPTGTDDTENIQCALDSAIAHGIALVKLRKGSFFISALVAESFDGALSGVSKTNTTITVMESSVDCAGMELAGTYASAIKFREGSPRVQDMTVVAESFCSTQGEFKATAIEFTGQPTGTDDCSNDVIFGVVDRLTLRSEDGDLNGIQAVPAGYDLGGCKQTLLGTIKINRSDVDGFKTGLITSMKGGAQVDVNYNTFTNNFSDTAFLNSNQVTYIVGNKFFGTPPVEASSYRSVAIATTSDDAPNQSKFIVTGNTFDIDASDFTNAFGVHFEQLSKVADLTALVVANTFKLYGSRTFGIVEAGVNAGVISKNSFRGDAGAGILLGGAQPNPSNDWTITANTGLSGLASLDADIFLGQQSTGAIVGPGQKGQIVDNGMLNTILPVEADVIEVELGAPIIMPAEPNEENFMAVSVPVPAAIVGRLSYIDDRDWFELTPDTPELKINFQAELNTENPYWQVEWFGPNGPNCAEGGDYTISRRNIRPDPGGFAYSIPIACSGWTHKVVVRSYGPQTFLFDDSQYILTVSRP